MNVAARRLAQRRAVLARPSILARSYATPVDYQPREKDPQLGDYPQLPDISRQTRPPTGWWDIQNRRNFGETLHEREELYSMWGPDIPNVPPYQALFQFGLAAFFFVGIGYTAHLLTPARTAVPREYPYDGLRRELGGLEENKANPESIEGEDE